MPCWLGGDEGTVARDEDAPDCVESMLPSYDDAHAVVVVVDGVGESVLLVAAHGDGGSVLAEMHVDALVARARV